MSALELAGFVALGVVAGTYGTLVGVGGGIIVVPVLLFMHVAPKDAAGTSMAMILANAASGSLSFLRQRRIDVRSGAIFSLAGLPGALAGGVADQYVPPRIFSFLFGVLLVIIAGRLIARPGPDVGGVVPEADERTTAGFRAGPALAIGLGAGFVASLFGVGGGIIFVPTMAYLFAFPAHIATATSTFIIALTAIAATASHAHFHDVLWTTALWIAVGAIAGAQIGARIAPRVRAPGLLRLFAVAVLLAAGWLFYKALV